MSGIRIMRNLMAATAKIPGAPNGHIMALVQMIARRIAAIGELSMLQARIIYPCFWIASLWEAFQRIRMSLRDLRLALFGRGAAVK